MKGDPRTLLESIEHGLAFSLGGHLDFANARAIEPFIRSFISQKFSAAMWALSDAEADRLHALLQSIVGPEPKKAHQMPEDQL